MMERLVVWPGVVLGMGGLWKGRRENKRMVEGGGDLGFSY